MEFPKADCLENTRRGQVPLQWRITSKRRESVSIVHASRLTWGQRGVKFGLLRINKKVRVTPEGSRIVDPLTIIRSDSILSHLRDVSKTFLKKPATR
jgi:hypothetical protein